MASPNVYANALTTLGPSLALLAGNYFSGTVRFVDSTHASASDANAGTEPELPTLTWTQAWTNASAGDLILVGASHVETVGSANVLAKADILTIGFGAGSTRPRFTSNVAGAMWTANAAGIGFVNLYFPSSTAATTARISSTAAETRIESCAFECGANDATTAVAIGAGADRALLKSCTFSATASRPARAVRVTSAVAGLVCDDLYIDGSSFGWSAAAFSIEAAATRQHLINVRLANRSDFVSTTTGTSYRMFGVRPVDSTGCRIVIAA